MSQETFQLKRTLKTKALVLFGLAYLTPMVVLSIFGVISVATHGAAPAAYLVAMIAMLFTAHSYGRMAKAYPVSGSAYTYVRKTIQPHAGFMVGWAVLLDYLFLPMVIWLIGASYLGAQFPAVPKPVWILLFIGLTSVLNIVGIQVAERANTLLMAFQGLVIFFFALLSIRFIFQSDATGFNLDPFINDQSGPGFVVAGAAIAAYSFLGFDAVTTLTEETLEPEKRMPRAIFLIALIGGLIFIALAYLAQLVHPGYQFQDPDSAAMDLALKIGGTAFGAVFLAGLVLAQFASGIAAQASASRLLYAMGRDGVLPKKIFGRLSRFSTPAINVVISGAVGLIAIVMSVSTSTSFVNFGGFVAFASVNLGVIFYFFRQRQQGTKLNVFSYAIAPTIGAVVCIGLLTQLDGHAKTIGVIWLGIGVAVLAVVTKGFKRQPPEMSEV
ncbi:APC family permease [Corynebacterium pelargi]|uniref:Putrescine importer PuuP n=1 Tax=Corynebacterium pelargi TaxID=1471400 RepID=A0A410W792_9CORY|nr:APC family permease [Corynebacterium pelargi]QAU51878.1 Putrescine importer PuuP [Corynebacterium pelargi]GGG71769.1 amino acid permease [Corynebacterium pelargi]